MSPETQGSKPLSGFAFTFGSQRAIPDSRSRDNRRASNDAGPNLKRRRTIDRSEERSPPAQRDRVEVSNPTTSGTVSNRQRNPDIPKQHLPNPLPKIVTDHKLADSLKFLHLFSETLEYFQLRGSAIKNVKRIEAIQMQDHYRSSGHASASDLLVAERRRSQEDIQRAEKHISEFHDKISPNLLSLLQGTMGNGDDHATPSGTADKPMFLSEARFNAIQNTIKGEIETPFKKELAESQQSMKDAFELQISKLKESLGHEYEQRLKSLRETLTQEGEERAKSLRESLVQENEKRIAEIRLSLARKNTERVAKLEKDLAEDCEKNVSLRKMVTDLKARLDQTTSEQRRMSESLVDKLLLGQGLLQLSKSQDEKLGELKVYMNELGNNTNLVQQLQQLEQISKAQKEKLSKLEVRLNKAGDNTSGIEDLAEQVCSLSTLITEKAQQLSDSQDERLGQLEASLNKAGDNTSRIEELEGQVRNLSTLITEKAQQLSDSQDKKLGELEASLRPQVEKTWFAFGHHMQQFSNSQDEKLGKLEVRLNQAGDNAPKIEDFSKLEARVNLLADNFPRFEDLEEQVRGHSNLIEEKKEQQHDFTTRLALLECTVSIIQAKELENLPTEATDRQEGVQNLSLNHQSGPVSAGLILQVIQPELAKNINMIKAMFTKVQSGLDEFIIKERGTRETLDKRCDELDRQLSDIQKGVTKNSVLDKKVTDQGQMYSNALVQVQTMAGNHINSVAHEFRSAFDGVFLQLQGLKAWQNNFNTRGLYMDILTHINKTLPDGTLRHLDNLKQRVETAETRISALENNISNKRRKLPSGNGHQISA